MVDPFTEMSFCQAHSPCPMTEEDKNGFLHLIKDIQTRGDTFVSQLKMTTLASMSSPRRQESSGTILSALFPSPKKKLAREDEKTRLDLWQARLILKLAEILDKEEVNLSRQFSSINSLEAEMLQHLRGDRDTDSNDPLLTRSTQTHNQPNAAITGNRMKAWITLYRHWDSTDIPVWISGREDAADILFEKVAKAGTPQPHQFLQIPLPTIGRKDKNDYYEKMRLFRKEEKSLQKIIEDLFNQQLQKNSVDPGKISSHIADTNPFEQQWLEAINHHFPEENYRRTLMTSHLLPGITFSELTGKENGSRSPFTNAILAILTPGS